MSDSKNNHGDQPEAFEDVLFSESSDSNNANIVNPDPDEQPGFDDVLFIDEEPKTTPKKPINTKVVPTLSPTENKQNSAPSDGLSDDLEAFADVASLSAFTQKQADFTNEALFANEDELEQALEQSPKSQSQNQENPDEITDALFNSDEDLELAVDNFSSEKLATTPQSKIPASSNNTDNSANKSQVSLEQYLQGFANPQNPKACRWFVDSLSGDNPQALELVLAEFEWPQKAKKSADQEASVAQSFWQKLQYQVKFHLGYFAPERAVVLDFKIPILKPKKHFPELLNHRQIQNVLARKGANINNSIAKVHQQLQWQNACALGFAERQRHIAPIEKFILQANNHLLQRFIKQPLQSQNKEAVQSASLHMAAIRLLLQSLRILINQAYRFPKAIYQQRQEAIRQLLLSYVTVAHHEAAFAACAHMQISNITAKSLNKIQQVIEQDEPSLLTKPLALALLDKPLTVKEGFGFWQLLYALDLASLPATLQPCLFSYLQQHQQDNWCIYTTDDSVPKADYLHWLENQDNPAMRKQNLSDGYALLLTPLFNAIKKDYMLLLDTFNLQQKQQQSPWPLLSWPEKTMLANFLMQALQCLQSGFKPAGKYSIYQPQKLHLAAGFTAATSCLANKNHTSSGNTKPIIGAVGPYKTSWQVAFADSRQMFLQAEEAQIKQPLRIGDCVLVEQYQKQDNTWQASLWLLKRLLRDELGALQLQLEAIGSQALFVEDNNQQHYCLCINESGQALTVTQAIEKLPEGTITFYQQSQSATVALQQLSAITPDAQVFSLQQ